MASLTVIRHIALPTPPGTYGTALYGSSHSRVQRDSVYAGSRKAQLCTVPGAYTHAEDSSADCEVRTSQLDLSIGDLRPPTFTAHR